MSLISRAVCFARTVVAALALTSVAAYAVDSSMVSREVDVIYQAFMHGKPAPVISHMLASFSLSEAYAIQRGYVDKRLTQDSIRGYKGGMTTAQAQKQFDMSEPVVGVLLASGEVKPQGDGSVLVNAGEFHRLMLETEVGIVFGEAITSPIGNIDELKKRARHVVPAIELPDLGFSDSAHLRGLDVVANNVSAKRYLFGTAQDKNQNLDNISAELRCNERPLNIGKATDVMGSPWQAALWEVNKLVELGYKIEPGQVLITGVMGRMVPAVPGKCVADFGGFGKLAFEVKLIAATKPVAVTK